MTVSQQLFEELETRIRTGAIPPGGVLPSENDLCASYSISRPTVRRVLGRLSALNLVVKKPGVGTFAANPEAKGDAWMTAPFRIGSEHLLYHDRHYTLPIISGMNRPPFGNRCYLKFLDPDKMEEGIANSDADALFLKELPETGAEQFLASGKPVMLCNRPSPRPDVPAVRVDHFHEARLGVEWLLKYGYRKIAAVEGYGSYVTSLRIGGWRQAYADAGLAAPEELILPNTFSDEKKVELVREYGCDAVFFTTGTIFKEFVPYYNILSGKNIAELRTLVFDDVTVYPEFKDLPLACIRMPLEEMGSFAVEYLRRKARFPETPVVDKVMKCQLVIKQ